MYVHHELSGGREDRDGGGVDGWWEWGSKATRRGVKTGICWPGQPQLTLNTSCSLN